MKNKEKHIDQLFEKARNEKPVSSFEETSEQFLSDLKAGKTTPKIEGIVKSINLKTWIIMFTILSAIAVTTIISLNNYTTSVEKEVTTDLKNSNTIEIDEVTPVNVETAIVVETIEIKNEQINTVTTTFNKSTPDTVLSTREEVAFKESSLPFFVKNLNLPRKKEDTIFRFPKLTQEEIKANYKQKAKMTKQLAKLDKKAYQYIPSGTFKHNESNISVQAFYMQRTEVTNLEYRTFLFDLLIQDRKEEFIKAKPDQKQWMYINGIKNSFNEPMTNLYFSHPAYNDYPINNISREGAEMYCNWLTSETAKVKKKNKEPLNDVRIPSNFEWMIAAYGGNKQQAYFPWGTPYTRNQKGCYLVNYKPVLDSNDNLIDSPDGVEGVQNKYAADGGFHTVNVKSYVPNPYGLYNMSGNVAEMVWNCPQSEERGKYNDLIFCDKNDRIPGTKGGGWLSDYNELAINGVDKYKGKTDAHANIGFRVVVTFLIKRTNTTGDNQIKVTPKTSRDDLEKFKEKAALNGVQLTYKAKMFSGKIRSLTVEMDTDNNPNNCGGVYSHNAFFGGNDNYLLIGWKETNGGVKLVSETNDEIAAIE